SCCVSWRRSTSGNGSRRSTLPGSIVAWATRSARSPGCAKLMTNTPTTCSVSPGIQPTIRCAPTRELSRCCAASVSRPETPLSFLHFQKDHVLEPVVEGSLRRNPSRRNALSHSGQFPIIAIDQGPAHEALHIAHVRHVVQEVGDQQSAARFEHAKEFR